MEPEVQKLLHLFFEKFELKSFAKGEAIIEPTNNKIFFLTKGVVKMFGHSRKSEDLTLNIYRADSIFPISLIFNIENKYAFKSLTEAQGYFASKKDFMEFVLKNPTVILDLLKRIYQGLDGFFMLSEALLSRNAYRRVLTQLVVYTRRFGRKNNNIIIFDWHLTHQQLASQTGLTRESVTRQIKKLQKRGLVGYFGKKLFIYDLSKLENELGKKLPS